MLVRHFMSSSIISLAREQTCEEALRLFHDRRIRLAPVMAGDAMVGMVAERDLLRVLPFSVAEIESETGRRFARMTVGMVMSSPVLSVGPDAHLEEVARLLLARRIGGVAVVQAGALIGMITQSDLFRAFTAMARHGGGTRLTLELVRREGAVDPVAIAVELGLCVGFAASSPCQNGTRMTVLRVQGERVAELVQRLWGGGWLVIEVDGEVRRAAG
jgi:acetoin utilization protein AcuB